MSVTHIRALISCLFCEFIVKLTIPHGIDEFCISKSLNPENCLIIFRRTLCEKLELNTNFEYRKIDSSVLCGIVTVGFVDSLNFSKCHLKKYSIINVVVLNKHYFHLSTHLFFVVVVVFAAIVVVFAVFFYLFVQS